MTHTSDIRVLGGVAFGIVTIFCCVIVYAVHGSLPHNPIALPFEEELSPRAWAPEGWKFFTRSPREEQIVLLVQRDGQWNRAEIGPASRPRYLFGLDRAGRAQGLEVGLIFEQIPQDSWRECVQTPLDCISSSAALMSIVNRSPSPTLCGAVGLAMQTPVPWSWQDFPRPVIMPSRIVRLEVRCSRA